MATKNSAKRELRVLSVQQSGEMKTLYTLISKLNAAIEAYVFYQEYSHLCDGGPMPDSDDVVRAMKDKRDRLVSRQMKLKYI